MKSLALILTGVFLILSGLAPAQQKNGDLVKGEKGGGGGGGGVSNGGNGLDGFVQTTARERLPRIIKHPENEKLLTAAERTAILDLIQTGIPFVAIDPAALEIDRYTDKAGQVAKTSLSPTEKRVRLLDNRGQMVDARVVRDTVEQTWLVQWDAISLEKATRNGVDAKPAFLRDVLHEVLRYAVHVDKMTRSDDNRAISGGAFVPASAMILGLKSEGYRLDIKKRAQALLALEEEMIQILKTDLKNHRSAPASLEVHESNAESFRRFLKDPKNFQHDVEGHAENFDHHERSFLLQRQTLYEQMNLGFRPLTLSRPDPGADEATRQRYIDEMRSRIIEICSWRADIRDTEYGRWAIRHFSAGSPPSDRNQVVTPAQHQAILDGWEAEATKAYRALLAAYRPRE